MSIDVNDIEASARALYECMGPRLMCRIGIDGSMSEQIKLTWETDLEHRREWCRDQARLRASIAAATRDGLVRWGK